jgi:hypothetical protein
MVDVKKSSTKFDDDNSSHETDEDNEKNEKLNEKV